MGNVFNSVFGNDATDVFNGVFGTDGAVVLTIGTLRFRLPPQETNFILPTRTLKFRLPPDPPSVSLR